MQEGHRRESFAGDLAKSFRVWRLHRWLPIISTAIYAIPALVPDQPVFTWLVTPVLLFNVGWVGTERIWYLRAFRGRSISDDEAWSFTWAFFGRYARLGLLIMVPLPAILALLYVSRTAFIVGLNLFSVPIDVVLTFVTPALAFSTDSVKTALGTGLRLIRSEWPASAWYVLVPPLAMLAAARLLPDSVVGIPARFGITVVAGLLYLAFKGATAAFYLRRFEVRDDGAADIGKSLDGLHPEDSSQGRNRLLG